MSGITSFRISYDEAGKLWLEFEDSLVLNNEKLVCNKKFLEAFKIKYMATLLILDSIN